MNGANRTPGGLCYYSGNNLIGKSNTRREEGNGLETFSILGFVFGMAGFTFGLTAFTTALTSSNKVKELEQEINEWKKRDRPNEE